jgi:hypothetical protein
MIGTNHVNQHLNEQDYPGFISFPVPASLFHLSEENT